MSKSIKKIIYLLGVLLISSYAMFFTNDNSFDFKYAMYPDAGVLYLSHCIVDSNSFINDPLCNAYRNSSSILDIDFLYFRMLSVFYKIFSLPLALTIIGLISCVLSVITVYKASEKISTENFAYLNSGLFLLYFLSMDSFYGGLPRALGVLMFVLFLLFLVRKKYFIIPFFMPLMIVSYVYLFPAIFIICILTVFFLLNQSLQEKKRYIYILLSVTILCAVYIYANYRFNFILKTVGQGISEIADYKYTQGVEGTITPYNIKDMVLYFMLNLNEHSRLYIYFSYFFMSLSVALIFYNRKKAFVLPKFLIVFIVGSLLSFFLLYFINPGIASRQLVFSLPIAMIFFCSINICAITEKYKIKPEILLAPVIVLFLIMHPQFNNIKSYKKYEPLYDYFKKLPANILIAGYPDDLFVETIPLISKRTVFFLDENKYLTYSIAEYKKRRDDLICVLYTSSINELVDFISRYKIDYFVIESYIYEKEIIPYLAKPPDCSVFSRAVLNEALDKKADEFIIFRLAKEYYDFKLKQNNYDIFILSSDKINNLVKHYHDE